ncbi:hypothetical protein [Roseibium marinum]|uniref:DUF4350 domain-containing protein n=1 Tax=Roseibium marinum TaxID=281252 RepID=A0A2S3UYU3_9HYPH|nr:hypothetical protein [Roseibium marinum]POF32639.1 hypothetical protein CLV41_10242 [Roseibium marinum]
MSETETARTPGTLRIETVVIVLVCAIGIAGLWYLLSQRQQTLRSSPAGFDGLQVWLASEGVSAQNFSGGWPIDQTSIGLLVVPVYDTALDDDRVPATTKQELLLQQDEYDLDTSVISIKARTVPTLVVLPKWRSGMRLTGLAHPVLKADRDRLASTLGKIIDEINPELIDAKSPFTDFPYRSTDGKDLRTRIYAAQMFKGRDCIPIIGTEEAMLLADCPVQKAADDQGRRLLVLSDPDLLNNHGLRLGDNARIALDFLRSKAADRNVMIDYSLNSWLRDPVSEPERERTWADLARFFGPPFLTLWIGAALAFLLFFWRGALRAGPIRLEAAAPGAGKLLAVRARARLMRLSGQDGALTREYAAARMSATAAALFGSAHARHYGGEEAFLKSAQHRHPAEAARLRTVLADIRRLPAHLPASEAIRLIDEFEQVLEQIHHDA